MIDISKGRYWDLPWSLVDGCTPCSPGCDHCWSAGMTHRFNFQWTKNSVNPPGQKPGHPVFNGIIITHPERLSIPLKRRKPAVYSIWNDWAHETVDHDFRRQMIRVAEDCPQHTFLALTKRPKTVLDFCRWMGDLGSFPDNWWPGLTVCNQQEADEKIPVFLQVPGKKFLSIEPMLGPVDIVSFLPATLPAVDRAVSGPRGDCIDAVILGFETGAGARPGHPDWVRSVRDQCAAAGADFFFKGFGEWAFLPKFVSATPIPGKTPPWGKYNVHTWDDGWSVRVGKKNFAGRLLDGRTHDDLPWRVP